ESMLAPMRAFSELMLVGFAGERILSAIEHTAELGASLVKLHEQTGIAVETLSGLHYAAGQVDVSADALDTSVKRLGRSIQEALRNPASEAGEAFKALGFTTDELRDHSNDLEFVLLQMAAAFQAHADGANADAIAQATLGRNGVELLSFLR